MSCPARRCHRVACDGLTVEPCRAVRRHLGFDREIGTDGKRHATLPSRIIELAELDDRTRRAVAGSVEVGQPDVVAAAVDAIDHGIGGPLEFVVETAIHEAADDGNVEAFAGQHVTCGPAIDAAFGQAAVDALDDVAAFAEFAQRRLGGLVHDPLAWPELMSEAEALQASQPADLQRMELIGLLGRIGRKVDDPVPVCIANKLAVELCPAFGFDLALERLTDIEIGAQPEFLCDEVLGAGAHPLLDVVPGDDEVLAPFGDAAHDDVGVRMLGVPVIDTHPIELGAEVDFHLTNQLASETFEVGHIRRVLGRDDEAEMVAVILTALREGLGIGILDVGAEQVGLLPVTGHALAPEITEVSGQRRRSRSMPDNPGFDCHQTRAAGE